jgi:hypothetical protein
MPDIDGWITEWRRSMAKHFSDREEVLDELEGHLRDEVEQLTQAGYPPEKALRMAMARLGQPGEIAAEFAKIPLPHVPWLPVRLVWIAGVALAAWLVGPLIPKLTAGGLNTLLAVHMGTVTLGYVGTLFVGFLAACFLLTRLFRDLNAGQMRSLRRAVLMLSGMAATLTGVGVALGGFCPYEKLGRFWGLDTREVGGVVILVWDLVMLLCCCLHRQTSKLAAMMFLGIVGNIVVILGWFGAAAIEKPSHGSPESYAMVIVLVLSQLAISCAALAPVGCLRGKRS